MSVVGFKINEDSFICSDCFDEKSVEVHKVSELDEIYDNDMISFDCVQCCFYWNSARKEFE